MTESYDPFARMDDRPVRPAFLVRDTDGRRAIERHRERMAAVGVTVTQPTRSQKAVAGKAAIAIAFDQQEAVLSALTGDYAKRYWADQWKALYRRWAMADIFETILADGDTPPERVRRVLGPILLEINPAADDLGRALLMIFRAWQLRQQVVIDRRPMSLIPVVGGQTLGSVTSFTPVVQRIGQSRWRVGLPGDKTPPRIIENTEVGAAVQEAMAEFNRRYFADQHEYFETSAASKKETRPIAADHIYFIPWGDKLRSDKTLPVGNDATLEEISHGRVFRLKLADGRQFILRATPPDVVKRSVSALSNGHQAWPPAPTPAEIQQAYLKEIAGRRAETRLMVIDSNPRHIRPFDGVFDVAVSYAVSIELAGGKRQEIVVAWVKPNPRRALAVVSGQVYPTRAALVQNLAGDKLALAPVSYTTHKLDPGSRWVTTPIAELNPTRAADREALSGWVAWVWFNKAHTYLPGRK